MSVQGELPENHDPEHFWAEQFACSGSKLCDAEPEHFCCLDDVSVQGQCWEDNDPEHFRPNSLHAATQRKCSGTLLGRQRP